MHKLPRKSSTLSYGMCVKKFLGNAVVWASACTEFLGSAVLDALISQEILLGSTRMHKFPWKLLYLELPHAQISWALPVPGALACTHSPGNPVF